MSWDGTSPAPRWWFGAPLLGLLLGLVANRFFPDFVPLLLSALSRLSGSDHQGTISPFQARILASLVGIVFAVGLLSIVSVSIRLMSDRRRQRLTPAIDRGDGRD